MSARFRIVLPHRARVFSNTATAEGATVPVNILKDGADPPLKPIEEYPEWIKTLGATGKTKAELLRMEDDQRTMDDDARLLKLVNRERIKELNESKIR